MTTLQMTRSNVKQMAPTLGSQRRCQPRDNRSRLLVGGCGRTITMAAVFALLVMAVGPMVSSVRADVGDTTGLFPSLSLGRYGQADPSGLGQQEPAVVKASFYAVADQPQLVVVQVDVALESPWHIYSLTQPKGGPLPTKMSIVSDDVLQIVGEWRADAKPKKSISEEFGGITVEEHEDEVKFFAVAKIQQADQTAESLPEIKVEISALTCMTGGACQPLDETLTASYAGLAPPALAKSAMVGIEAKGAADTELSADAGTSANSEQVDTSAIPLFQDEDYAIRWRAYVTPASLRPGQQGKLVFTALPEGEYHTYPGVVGDDPMSTNFAVEDKAGLKIAAPKTDAEIIKEELVPGLVNQYHDGDVTWTMPIEIPADAKPGKKTIRGAIGYQACTASSCLVPKAVRFEAVVNVVAGDPAESTGGAQAAAMTLTSAKFGDVKKLAGNTQWVDKITPAAAISSVPKPPAAAGGNASDDATVAPLVMEDSSGTSMTLPVLLGFALLGGFILNFMPCVLPVVGLKVMSFVQQAGSDRRRAFLLNFSYAAGIMAIFVLLAVLMVVFSMAWGEMFTHPEVRIALIVLMFAMALSYFGVWELPAPGMASSKGAQELQQREGYTGAFFKGMFATVLSTPCSGPFLGGIFALIGGKLPPLQSTIVILVVGLGMSVPYVIMGIWPKMMSWLPKPGPWMETFKEFLAFLFLATVAFFFYTFDDADKMWVFAALMGVWFGCWIIGKTPSWQTAQRRLIAWVSGIGVAVAISLLAFTYLGPAAPDQQTKQELLAWEPYDEVRLQELHAEGKTVLVDFSAKWCLSCLVNLGVAIDTQPTADLVEELGVVTMYADWTDRSPEIKAKLDELQSKSIPLLAIYPGSDPSRPILLRDLVTQQNVLNALRQAGPSQSGPLVTHKPEVPKTLVTR
ncbi:protein-disulfide reductase DsbD family protein [Allorhodopirellula heiligendammensis]|uniref:Thiol:disulfide interchange protein DsbD n=1 Tax=Allorhodopirellula heiligendammensis TaxID=2714739 RepID=A0A5C6BW18_9BACT|nr:cytochrome c biogenesis protein CcdA [Allorhodopirellula heiligendammensis]TWU16473.1 Thiol:disulfide interchange protein DsbD precursor [Allorhodopirellula heiligendammensis]